MAGKLKRPSSLPPPVLQLDKKLRGCFVYTSSAAAMIPNPFSVLYASTKSFLSSFGASLAAEVSRSGVEPPQCKRSHWTCRGLHAGHAGW
jgi:hypothetical protein